MNVVLGSGFDFTKAQSNGGDIRFTASDGVTLLPYWIESWNAGSSSASLWVKVPSIPAAGATVYHVLRQLVGHECFERVQHF